MTMQNNCKNRDRITAALIANPNRAILKVEVASAPTPLTSQATHPPTFGWARCGFCVRCVCRCDGASAHALGWAAGCFCHACCFRSAFRLATCIFVRPTHNFKKCPSLLYPRHSRPLDSWPDSPTGDSSVSSLLTRVCNVYDPPCRTANQAPGQHSPRTAFLAGGRCRTTC